MSSHQTAASGSRADRLAKSLSEAELDLLLVANLVNVGYLTGFTGTNGICLVGPEERTFLTDFRYTERAEAEVGKGWERPVAERELTESVIKRLKGRVGFEDGHLSVRQLRRLEKEAPDGVEFVPAGDLVEDLRKVKDEGEIEAVAAAASLTDEVYAWVLDEGLAGKSEREVARAAEARIRELGAEPAFPVIVAAGANGALPHAEAGERQIGKGEMVVFDMGARLDGYCSDCTRTFAAGEAGEEAREIYQLVLGAQEAALEAANPGVEAKVVDTTARALIEEAGHGEHFGHSTGHGVGLEIHEGPTVSTKAEDKLEPGNVVTIEPGVYIPGRLGVRIEDLVVVTGDGHRNLSSLPKRLTVVD